VIVALIADGCTVFFCAVNEATLKVSRKQKGELASRLQRRAERFRGPHVI